jgi:hypothetical protein
MGDLLWPAAIVVFVGFVFFLVTRFVGIALGERESEWGPADADAPPTRAHLPPGAPA